MLMHMAQFYNVLLIKLLNKNFMTINGNLVFNFYLNLIVHSSVSTSFLILGLFFISVYINNISLGVL